MWNKKRIKCPPANKNNTPKPFNLWLSSSKVQALLFQIEDKGKSSFHITFRLAKCLVVTVKHYKNFGSFIKKNSPSNIISDAKSQRASYDVFVNAVSAFNKQHSKHSQADKLPILKTLPGPNDEAKERFCFLLILQQMASSEDSENEYLIYIIYVNYFYEMSFIIIDTFH